MKKLFVSFITTFLLVFMLTSCPGLMSDQTCSVSFCIDGVELAKEINNYASSREGIGDDCFMTISLEGKYTASQTVPFADEMTVTFDFIPVGTKVRALARIYVLEVGTSGSTENVLASGESDEVVVKRGKNEMTLWLGAPHTVTFNSNGGSELEQQTVEFGKRASRPADPTRDGKVFRGWYVDANYTTEFDFNTVITEDTTLYAKWATVYQVAIDSNITNGTITADKSTAMQGETVTLTISASSGYEFNTLSVNNDEGVIISTTAITSGRTYTFTMPEGNVRVSATFVQDVLPMVDVTRSTVTITGADPSFVDSGTSSQYKEYKGVFRTGRNVTLSPYRMSKYEITQEVYAEYMAGEIINGKALASDSSYNKETGSHPLVSGEIQSKRPVDGVTWYDAVYFCNVLTEKTLGADKKVYTITGPTVDSNGHITSAEVTMDRTKTGYRLPTEAEWEFAARGGDTTAADWNHMFSGHAKADGTSFRSEKNSGMDSVGWYKYNTKTGTTGHVEPSEREQGYGTHEVGKKSPNRLGIYDMSGNVTEWCWDWHNDSVGTGNVTDPAIADSGSYRVIRGGHWDNDADCCSVCYREGISGLVSSPDIGFRVVRSISE